MPQRLHASVNVNGSVEQKVKENTFKLKTF